MRNKRLQMAPWDLAEEASDEAASSVGVVVAGVAGAGAGAVVSLSASEVNGSTGANGPGDEECRCA